MTRVIIDTGDGTFIVDGEAIEATEVALVWKPGGEAKLKYVTPGTRRNTRATNVEAWVHGDAEVTETPSNRKKNK